MENRSPVTQYLKEQSFRRASSRNIELTETGDISQVDISKNATENGKLPNTFLRKEIEIALNRELPSNSPSFQPFLPQFENAQLQSVQHKMPVASKTPKFSWDTCKAVKRQYPANLYLRQMAMTPQ